MAKKPTKGKGAAEAAPDVHRAAGIDVDDVIRRADEGDKYALRELYRRASAWARGGLSPIPEPLGTWIADRLLNVARVIDARKDADIGRSAGTARGGGGELEAALAVALGARRASKPGRAPSRQTDARARGIAQDVLHFMHWEGLHIAAAQRRVMDYYTERRLPPADIKAVEAAWAKHGATLVDEAGLEYRGPKFKPAE
jgi:hypothetical protein